MDTEIVVINGEISEEEKLAYLRHVKTQTKRADIKKLIITLDGEFVNLEWHFIEPPFDRVRRITGYLVGTLDRFNNGKRAEVKDRVKHNVNE